MADLDSKFGASFTGGGAGARTYFKPEDHVAAPALMIEVKGTRQSDNPYFDTDKPEAGSNTRQRLEIIATVTVFATPEGLEAGVGKEFPNVVINQTYLASDLKDSVGKIEVYKLHLQPNKKNPSRKPSWVWRGVEGKVVEQVKDYYLKREADIEAALNDEDTPAFLKNQG